jgi:hypothetical protein
VVCRCKATARMVQMDGAAVYQYGAVDPRSAGRRNRSEVAVATSILWHLRQRWLAHHVGGALGAAGWACGRCAAATSPSERVYVSHGWTCMRGRARAAALGSGSGGWVWVPEGESERLTASWRRCE